MQTGIEEIPKNERSPRYFGYCAKNGGFSKELNPYPSQGDGRYAEWLRGYDYGVLINSEKEKENAEDS